MAQDTETVEFKNRKIDMSGPLASDEMQFLRAVVVEGLSRLTEITVEFASANLDTNIEKIVGENITITLQIDDDGNKRHFGGYCVSVEFLGTYEGQAHFVAELRPWLWFLTQTEDNRIFQEKSALEIIKQIFGDYGFSDYSDSTSGSYATREYCVQYGESDFDFISRLMEEEGIHYAFETTESKSELSLHSGNSGHSDIPINKEVEFYFREEGVDQEDCLYEFASSRQITPGKVTLRDYDFTTPGADKTLSASVKPTKERSHPHGSYELFRYPGRNRISDGDPSQRARVLADAEAARFREFRAKGNVRRVTVGGKLTLSEHPLKDLKDKEYLITEAVHFLQFEAGEEQIADRIPLSAAGRSFDDTHKEAYTCELKLIQGDQDFLPPAVTRRPRIFMQTAVVTGPSGEEIYTDEYGRIKVQFHWDREGQKDQNTTCYVRVVMPWSGQNWGMFSIPRIGQEVVIEFEDGDPDRPICTGMVYNADNMPPYTLPTNMTQTGIVTRSTKQGSAQTFHELVFEDKKDAEFVRFQSERDYKATIKNNAEITIGLEHMDEGDLTQTIYHTKTETIKTGDDILTVEKGDQTVTINEGHQTVTVETGNQTVTVETGNQTISVNTGNQTIHVEGDHQETINGTSDTTVTGQTDLTVTSGDYVVAVTTGSIDIEAATQILLTCGPSTIKMTPDGIDISAPMITITGDATVDVGSPLTTVGGDVILTLQGAIVNIN